MAWLTSSVGLSLAFGAFLAGIILSESHYSHQALGVIMPFRYVFTSFFFISIGMLLDLDFFLDNPILIIAAAVAAIAIKLVAGIVTTLIMGYSMRVALYEGLAIAHVGEFSFILSKIGMDYGLLTPDIYQIFMATSILTMAASPFLVSSSQGIASNVCRLPLPRRFQEDSCPVKAPREKLKDHLVIIGYGVNSKNIARATRSSNIPYVILEMNPDTVVLERAKGEPIHYGDATQEIVLEHLNLEDARIAVVTVPDSGLAKRITSMIRKHYPKVHLIVRTRYVNETKSLLDLGADEVIPEDFETSVEIFARVLKSYDIPKDRIDKFVSELRSGNYDMLRSADPGYSLNDLITNRSNLDIMTVRIREGLPVLDRYIRDMELRKKYGVTVLLIRRNDQYIYNPDPDEIFHAGDIVYLFGTTENLAEVFGPAQPFSA